MATCYCCCSAECFMWLVQKCFYLYTFFAVLCYIGIIGGVYDFLISQILLYLFFCFLLYTSMMEVKVNSNSGFLQGLIWIYLFFIVVGFIQFASENSSKYANYKPDQEDYQPQIVEEDVIPVEEPVSYPTEQESTPQPTWETTNSSTTYEQNETTSSSSETSSITNTSSSEESPVPSWAFSNQALNQGKINENNLEIKNQKFWNSQFLMENQDDNVINNHIDISLSQENNNVESQANSLNLNTFLNYQKREIENLTLNLTSDKTSDTIWDKFYSASVRNFRDTFGSKKTTEFMLGLFWALWHLNIANGIRVFGDDVIKSLQHKNYNNF